MRLWPCIFALGLSDATEGKLYKSLKNCLIHNLDRRCDLQQLVKPKFALNWSCDKPNENGKVSKKTKCEIVCPDDYDIFSGEKLFRKKYEFSVVMYMIYCISYTSHIIYSIL